MKKHLTAFLTLAVLSLVIPPASAQVCGDGNSDGKITLGDVIVLIDKLCITTDIDLPPEADCDGRAGLTVGDPVALTQALFWTGTLENLDCTASLPYGFNPAPDDTVFIPYMTDIPDGVDVVQMPVMTHFQSDTRGFYVPLLVDDATRDGFVYSDINLVRSDIALLFGGPTGNSFGHADTALLFGSFAREDILVGRHDVFTIDCSRTETGLGAIHPLPIDRAGNWRIAVEKDGDLYVPVIIEYEYTLPDPVLTVSETSLSFSTAAGEVASTTYTVDFTTDGLPVSFDLVPSDPWITIAGLPGGDLSTPLTITVGADATELGIGQYTGQISILNLDPPGSLTNTDVIDISFNVYEPGLYPVGDINCDGIVSIGDIAVLVDHLFISGVELFPCD